MSTPFLEELGSYTASKWDTDKILEAMEKTTFPGHLEKTWENVLRPNAKREARRGFTSYVGCFHISDYKFKSFVPSRQDVIDNLPDQLAQAWAAGALSVDLALGANDLSLIHI